MKIRLQTIPRQAYRYLVIGGIVYIFELLVIILAQHFGASAVVAVGISFCSGTTLSFALQKFVTFGDRRLHHKILIPQFIAVCLLVVFNFGFTLIITKLLSTYVSAIISRTIAISITTCWNFYLYRTRIFKSDDNPVY